MSLINQMLQDLDKRSVDGAGSISMNDNIRAVPEHDSANGIKWVALVLVVILAVAGGGLWYWLRPAPVVLVMPAAPPAEPARSLIMKPEPALTETPQTIPQSVAVTPRSVDLPTPDMLLHPKAAPVKKLPEFKPPAVLVNNGIPTNINKQMKELTAQQRAENEYRKSVALMQQGRVADAIAGLEQAIQIDPSHASARQTLVGLLIESKRQDEAIRKLQDGLNLDPSQAGMAMVLARLQVEKNDVHAGTEVLLRTLPYAVERADYQSFLAALLQREGRHKDAIEHYLVALRKSPQSGVWWMGLGISLQAENRGADAQEAFSRAKATNSLTPELQAFVEQKLKQLQH